MQLKKKVIDENTRRKYRPVTLYISYDLLDVIDKLQGLGYSKSRSGFVRSAIAYYLKEQEINKNLVKLAMRDING